MKIYIDLELILNFCYDLLLIMSVSIILKRVTKLRRIILASIIGSLSILILFLNINSIILFILKILASIIMVLVAFGYKNIKYLFDNLVYLYMCSVTLGGFMYLLDIEFSYKREGIIFYFNGLSINYIVLVIISPIILYFYIRSIKLIRSTYNYNYDVIIEFLNGKVLKCSGYLDSANRVKDPISGKYVVIVREKLITPYINIRSPIYVVYKTINGSGIMKCFKIKDIKINNHVYKNYLIGITDNINLAGSDCLLNYRLTEDICLEN